MAGRIVIVGAVAGGATAATSARRANEDAEIVLLDAGPYMSWANCGLPYYVGGEIEDRDELFAVEPSHFARRFRVDVRLGTRAMSVSPQAHTVTLQDAGGGAQTLHYDRLILAPGAVANQPAIPGLDGPATFYCRTVDDADAILRRLDELGLAGPPAGGDGDRPARHALVIGGGYIGLECVEQLHRRGLRVTVVDIADQVMTQLDAEMALLVQRALQSNGVEVLLRDTVQEVQRRGSHALAVLRSGREVPFALAIVSVGVRPAVELARHAGLRLGPTGAVAVDAMQRTSDPHVYAAGDVCEAPFVADGRPMSIPLAGPARKQGRTAGVNAALDLSGAADDDGRRLRFAGVCGTSIVRVFDVVAAQTGLNASTARKHGVAFETVHVGGHDHASYYPGAESMMVKLLYAPRDGRLLGAQVVGAAGVDKRIDVLATALYAGLKVQDLEQLDLAYAPPYGSASDVVITAGGVAADALRGTGPGIEPEELLAALEGDRPPVVLDVRTRGEFDRGHLPGAVHVPVDDLRARLDEVPRGRTVAVYCGGGYRSHIAQRILLGRGWDDVRNVYGGYDRIEQARALRNGG